MNLCAGMGKLLDIIRRSGGGLQFPFGEFVLCPGNGFRHAFRAGEPSFVRGVGEVFDVIEQFFRSDVFVHGLEILLGVRQFPLLPAYECGRKKA